jgi:hypothetical protein
MENDYTDNPQLPPIRFKSEVLEKPKYMSNELNHA